MNLVPAGPIRGGLLADVERLRPGDSARLQASRCDECGRMEFPGRADCPWCGEPSELVALGPEATLAGFTAVLHPAPGSLVDPPYDIGVARFAAGMQVMGLLLTGGAAVELGARLETCAVDVPDGRVTYAFRLA